MAYTTPATATAGTVLTASFLNTNLRDNIAWLATDAPACRVYRTTAQSIASGSPVAITFGAERYDNAAMHSTSSNTSRITVPTGGGGKYLIGGGIQFAASSAGTSRGNYIQQNATTYVAIQTMPPQSAGTPVNNVLAVYALVDADYVEMLGYQDTGSALNVNSAGNFSPELYAQWFRV